MKESAIPFHTIRRATERDAPELARLFTALGHPTAEEEVARRWGEWDGGGNVALVAASVDGMLHGAATLHQMVVLHRPRPVGRITLLVVDALMRGRGIGRSLVAAAEEIFTRAGCGLVEITSNEQLVGAQAFYEHLGYKRTSVRLAKSIAPAN